MASKEQDRRVHVAHVLHSFRIGGLENGVVNLINNLPRDQYRHSIICVTDFCPEYFTRINSDNCQIYSLNKPPGKGLGWLWRCWRLFRKIKPDVIHSRNLSALESQLAQMLTGARHTVHGEHGWDVNDLAGANQKNQRIKRFFKPFVDQYIALSKEGERYLVDKIGIRQSKVTRICNGVDINKFDPAKPNPLPSGMPEQISTAEKKLVFGTVGRATKVKNQMYLLDAFIELANAHPAAPVFLIVVGDGPELASLQQRADSAGVIDKVWFPGSRNDVDLLLAQMDVFVLPSLAEGISNVFLEAMAAGLPVIATNVGGNSDLMLPEHAKSHLIPLDNIASLTAAMQQYVDNYEKLAEDSKAVRQHCVNCFSIQTMVEKYHHVYQQSVG